MRGQIWHLLVPTHAPSTHRAESDIGHKARMHYVLMPSVTISRRKIYACSIRGKLSIIITFWHAFSVLFGGVHTLHTAMIHVRIRQSRISLRALHEI